MRIEKAKAYWKIEERKETSTEHDEGYKGRVEKTDRKMDAEKNSQCYRAKIKNILNKCLP